MNDYTAETGNSRNLRRGAHQLLELYRGHWGQLFWAAFWFTVKHSPAWVTPIVIANIINIVTDPEHHNLTQFWLNLIVGSVFIAQNVLTAWLHTRASSGLTRGVEMELRGAMVHKLQRLSIQYHTQAQTGRLLSKIMRDVENVEQMMQSCFSSMPVPPRIFTERCIGKGIFSAVILTVGTQPFGRGMVAERFVYIGWEKNTISRP